MSSSMLLVKVTCMAMMMCMILGLPQTLSALTCGQVEAKLAPCVPYVTGIVGAVPQPCCDGITAVNNQSTTKDDRQAACRCIDKAAKALPGLNVDALVGLPSKCGVKLPFNLGPSTDCNKIE
ncbi:non-specific lipid-transfer protein 1-like [Vicia villosa]|uniref:non-specific lipid-transfer protein 1-like n=1 Tax=Vicia villosa TaxID=3911 RepID=UPI00273AD006|nr:non-specific lipid-transfer protein 1-like [Vicia villosa]